MLRRSFAVLIVTLLTALAAVSSAAAQAKAPTVYIPQPPKELSLCGEKVPLHKEHVAEALDREFHIAVHDTAQVVMWMKRASRYFPYFSARLKEAGLPDDLKYLAVAESALLHRSKSWAGAVGAWQFIPATGRRYGLRYNRWFDDRRNVEKATTAAVAYLKDLYELFDSWPLAMAAYNCGESRVKKAMEEQGQRDYYELVLPRETQRYVFRVMAAKIVLSNPEKYGYHLPKSRLYQPHPCDQVDLKLKRYTHLKTIADSAGTTVRRVVDLNPEIRGMFLPPGRHNLTLPKGAGAGFDQKLAKAKPSGSHLELVWVVKPGDSLGRIAAKTGCSIKALRRANGLSGSTIRPGQKLVIPKK